MPYRPGRPCSHPGCTNLVRGRNRRFCALHQHQEWQRQDARRGTSTERGYGEKWRIVRARYLARNPRCYVCGTRATIAHHVIRRRDGGSDAEDNLRAMCIRCHNQLHARAGELFGHGG